MLRIFRNVNPVSLLLLALYTAITGYYSIAHPAVPENHDPNISTDILFFHWLHLGEIPPYISALIAEGIIFIQAILLVLLVRQFKLFPNPGLIPALIYILIFNLFPDTIYLSPLLILNFICFRMLFRIFRLYNSQKADTAIFDIGLLNGIFSVIYFPSAAFIVFSIQSLFRLRSTSFRELLVLLSGIFVILFLTATAYFWFDRLEEFTAQFTHPAFLPADTVFPGIDIFRFCLLAGLLLFSLFYLSTRFTANLIQTRKYLGTAVFFIIFCVGTVFLQNTWRPESILLLFLPAALFIANYLANTRSRLAAEIVHMVLLGTVLLLQYVTFA